MTGAGKARLQHAAIAASRACSLTSMSQASWSQHLPPVAAERVRRQAESHVAGSLLSAPAAAALASADREPLYAELGFERTADPAMRLRLAR